MSLKTLKQPAPLEHANPAYPAMLVNTLRGKTNAEFFADRDFVPYYKRAKAHTFSCAETGKIYLYRGTDIEDINWQNAGNWVIIGEVPASVEPEPHTPLADTDKFLINVNQEFKEIAASAAKDYLNAEVNARIDSLNDETNIVEVNNVTEFKAALAVNREAVSIVVNTPLMLDMQAISVGAKNAQILGANAITVKVIAFSSTITGADRRISFQTPIVIDYDGAEILFIDRLTLDIQDLSIAGAIAYLNIASSAPGSVLNLAGTADNIINNTPSNLTINENAAIPSDLARRVQIISNNMRLVTYTAATPNMAATLMGRVFQSGVFYGSETNIRRIAMPLPNYPEVKCIAVSTFLTGSKCETGTLRITGGTLAEQNITFESDVVCENIAITKPDTGVLNLYFSNIYRGGLDAINVTVTGPGTGTVNIYSDNDAPLVGTGFTLFNNRLGKEFDVNYFTSDETSSLSVTITKSGALAIRKRVRLVGGNAPAEQHVIFPVLGYRCNLAEISAHLSAISEPNKYISDRLIEIPNFFGINEPMSWGLSGHLLGHRQKYAEPTSYRGYTYSGADLSTDVTVSPIVMNIGARNGGTVSDWHVWDFCCSGYAYKINV